MVYQGNTRYRTGGQTIYLVGNNGSKIVTERQSSSRRKERFGDPPHRRIINICAKVLESQFQMNKSTTIKYLFQDVIVEVTL